MFYIIRDFLSYYTPTPPEGVYCFTSVHPSFRPSKIFFSAFFSATIDGRNLIFGDNLHIGIPYCRKRFWTHQIPTSCLPTQLMSMLFRSPILLGSFYIIILLGIFYFNRDFFLYYYEFSVLFGIAYIFFYFINGFPILLGNCYIIKDFLCSLGFPILLGILHVIRDFLYYWGFFILLGISCIFRDFLFR